MKCSCCNQWIPKYPVNMFGPVKPPPQSLIDAHFKRSKLPRFFGKP